MPACYPKLASHNFLTAKSKKSKKFSFKLLKTQRFRFQNENQLKFLPQKTILGGTSGARLCFRIPRKGL
jgi:hypothetical protein